MQDVRKLKDAALVKVWLKRYHDLWLTKQFALDCLNAATGCRYQHGHISRWERGERAPCEGTQNAMRNLIAGIPKGQTEE
jgi:hypothetical protein